MKFSRRAAAIGLALCPRLERTTLRRLFKLYGDPLDLWLADSQHLVEFGNLTLENAHRLEQWRNSIKVDGVEAGLVSRGVVCLLPNDERYTDSLSELPDPPVVLFATGRVDLLADTKRIAIVGTRRASGYGMEATNWVAETFARSGCTVVSGLALGIDAAAHRATLRAQGDTLAVLGCGIDTCYPSSHQGLYEEIRVKGLIVSEYPPGMPVAKHRFPERNRLIAALSRAIVVIQAGERSGALRTVDSAVELGKDVYVVPGPITSVHFRGSHKLLQEGAQILVDPHDCLLDFGCSPPQEQALLVPERWKHLYGTLTEATTAQQLAEHTGTSIAAVYAGLLELELAGWIERLPGGLYRRMTPV